MEFHNLTSSPLSIGFTKENRLTIPPQNSIVVKQSEKGTTPFFVFSDDILIWFGIIAISKREYNLEMKGGRLVVVKDGYEFLNLMTKLKNRFGIRWYWVVLLVIIVAVFLWVIFRTSSK